MKRFKELPKSEWPNDRKDLIKVFLVNDFLVHVYDEEHAVRISVERERPTNNIFIDAISWENIQRVKAKIGYSEAFAVECYPEDVNSVELENVRHLFIVERPPFAWSK
ncbi:DUF7694 domain-containing protein [Paraglaciecola sp.]|uniref:DUF7694 domain-containing protein n=1 Tax=Paraglaciecola sp. TaxID=1920173 RepID=UPI003EF9D2CB